MKGLGRRKANGIRGEGGKAGGGEKEGGFRDSGWGGSDGMEMEMEMEVNLLVDGIRWMTA